MMTMNGVADVVKLAQIEKYAADIEKAEQEKLEEKKEKAAPVEE